MKIFRMLAVAVVLSSGVAAAGTDYQCMQNCADQGYLYGFCKSKCSYDTEMPTPAPVQTRTDYKCMSDCSEAGYMYAYCKSRCTY